MVPSAWWKDIQHIFFSHCRFCRTSESSFWVGIPNWQAYQLLNKYYCYMFLGSIRHQKCFQKDLTWQDLGKALPYSSKHRSTLLRSHLWLPSDWKQSCPHCWERWYWPLRADSPSGEGSCLAPGPACVPRGVPVANSWSVLGSKSLAHFLNDILALESPGESTEAFDVMASQPKW